MKNFLKKNLALVLAFLLPIGLIVIVALTTYLPSLFISTDYNFVYVSCADSADYYADRCPSFLQKFYTVSDGKLVINQIDPTQDSDGDGVPDIKESHSARFFLHDTKKNEGREITLEEAQTLSLNGLLTSPDGVTVSSRYDRGDEIFFVFGGSSSRGYYLTKGRSRDRLNLINDSDRYYYRDNFQFIGWILPGRNS
jgi:hypothetical protein